MFDKHILYKFTFPDGMVYIGTTKSIKTRWAGDGINYSSGVKQAIERYGWENIKREIIVELEKSIENNDKILKLERELISAYGSRAYNSKCNAEWEKVQTDKRKQNHVAKSWTVNGITKPASQWCAEYGISYSCVLKRMSAYGLTQPQALTFPSVPREYRKQPMQYWQEHGLI